MARLSGLAKDTPAATGFISAGQATAECHVSEGKDITDMDYDVSATSSSTRMCMDKASVSSSPRIQNEDFVDVCSVCAKPKRINTLPEIQNMISFWDGKCHPSKLSCSQDGSYGISRHEGQHEEQCHIVEEEESALDNHDNENNTCAKCEHGKLERQYFVKYKGLAHVHNRWVAEKQLSEEAPALIDKFKKRVGRIRIM